MYNVSIPMALVDYIPVIFFGVSMVLLQRDLYNKMFKGAYALFAAGTIDVFCAGFLKATWKLLYAAGVCDFEILNHMMMPLQSIGFLLIGAGLVGMLCWKRKDAVMLSAAPAVFSGTFVFIILMVLGLGCLCTVLSILAARMKKKGIIALFVLAFLCYMGMGYMSSQDSTLSWVNWVEQSINCVGQGLMMIGVILLHKAGLAEYKFREVAA